MEIKKEKPMTPRKLAGEAKEGVEQKIFLFSFSFIIDYTEMLSKVR